jgi:hypothetical protein
VAGREWLPYRHLERFEQLFVHLSQVTDSKVLTLRKDASAKIARRLTILFSTANRRPFALSACLRAI